MTRRAKSPAERFNALQDETRVLIEDRRWREALKVIAKSKKLLNGALKAVENRPILMAEILWKEGIAQLA